MDPVASLALALGLSWASGVRLYAVFFILGVLHLTEAVALPPDLQVLAHPVVLVASGAMVLVEFSADKIPGVDTLWDIVHTLLRIPAGVWIAMGVAGDTSSALAIAAGILGGSAASMSHFTKAGTRVLINTSPEPVTNWTASFAEDFLVLAAIWAAFQHPWLLLALLALFIALVVWLLPRLFRAVWYLIRKAFALFGVGRSPIPPAALTLPQRN